MERNQGPAGTRDPAITSHVRRRQRSFASRGGETGRDGSAGRAVQLDPSRAVAILPGADNPPWNGAFGLIRKNKIAKAVGAPARGPSCAILHPRFAPVTFQEPRNASKPDRSAARTGSGTRAVDDLSIMARPGELYVARRERRRKEYDHQDVARLRRPTPGRQLVDDVDVAVDAIAARRRAGLPSPRS